MSHQVLPRKPGPRPGQRIKLPEPRVIEGCCPNCGEVGGRPVSVPDEDRSSGYSAEVECCTLCAPRSQGYEG
jgi:hypothetical protein